MTINETAESIHENSINKGFYDNESISVAERLCLIHSEVSEALEADRNDKYTKIDITRLDEYVNNYAFELEFESNVKNTFEDELADVMIRVMDLAASMEIDLESHVKHKMRYNTLRPHMHNKRY